MVKNPRTPAGAAGTLVPLNLPQPTAVEVDSSGQPAAVLVRGRLRAVVAINDRWRIDDEWWREEISRAYFVLELEGGMAVTVFRDLVRGGWFQHQYTPPIRLQAG